MDTTNYLQNWLSTRRKVDKIIIIPEQAWTEVRQNFEHIQIFDSKGSIQFPSEKRSKFDVYKTWNRIFIRYIDTTKHLRTWTPKTHQVLIASEPVVIKSKRGAELLVDNLIPPPKLLQQPAGKQKPRGRPRKRPCVEDTVIKENARKENASRDELAQAIMQTKRMRIHPPHNPKSRTDLGRTLSKNLANGLVRPTQELTKSVTKTSSKVWKPKIYDEAINDPVYGNR